MIRQRTATAAALAALVVLAGCSAGVPGTGGDDGGTGTVNVYVSDERNAIDQFSHLNVTVEEVTLVRVNESVEGENDGDGESDGDRVTHDIDSTTLDLTELQGANASQIGRAEVPNGTYTMVVLHVSEVQGTLTDGSTAEVKLPSEKLRVNENFTVGDGEEVDFVFDVSVVERGQNGYILKPVAGQSGTSEDVDVDPVETGEQSDRPSALADAPAPTRRN